VRLLSQFLLALEEPMSAFISITSGRLQRQDACHLRHLELEALRHLAVQPPSKAAKAAAVVPSLHAKATRNPAFSVLASFGSGYCLARAARHRRLRRAVRRCRGAALRWAARRAQPDGKDGIDFEVTPWTEEVEPRPILAVSDSTGSGARRFAECAWAQFGSTEAARLAVHPEVCSAEHVRTVVEEAARDGALVIYTLASSELCLQLASECSQQNIPCIDLLQPLLTTLEEITGRQRLGSTAVAAPPENESEPVESEEVESPLEIYVASDSSGSSTYQLVRAALRQFPGSRVRDLTVCPEVCTLEEIRLVARTAGESQGLVAFTFASTGMSRFMRQQCEAYGARFVDVYQPLLLAMEIYLQYPAIGVPGGFLDREALSSTRQKWSRRRI